MFGAKSWCVIPKKKVKKVHSHSREAVMLGFLFSSKVYKLWDTDLSKVIVARDVTFYESDCGNGTDDTDVSIDTSDIDDVEIANNTLTAEITRAEENTSDDYSYVDQVDNEEQSLAGLAGDEST